MDHFINMEKNVDFKIKLNGKVLIEREVNDLVTVSNVTVYTSVR